MQLRNRHLLGVFVSFGVMFLTLSSISHAQDQSEGTSPEIEAIAEKLELFVMPEAGPFRPDKIKIANQTAIGNWARSGHSDASSEAFAHWNDDGEIPPICATCHAGTGFRTFHGLDGSAPGLPEKPVPVGGVVDCGTCHDPNLGQINEVKFPSGLMHPVSTTAEASCMTCHQGRAAGNMISTSIAEKDLDTPDPELSFINPHYAVAASTWLGGYGGSGYQYAGKVYSGRFFHARPMATCVSCHEPHSLEVAQETCRTCHEEGAFGDIRLSRLSYDGSGNLEKGIQYDIQENAHRLLDLVIEYSNTVAGTPMVFENHRYPYFFADANADGRVDEVEGRGVSYNAWTPRLLRAAYNWKFVTSDAGAFVHNPHYVLELLFDSTEDLSTPLGYDINTWNIKR